jgi:hypothetical protein
MTGARCSFCGRTFRNQQAVRAHLKACPSYRQLPKAAVPRTGSVPGTPRGRPRTPVPGFTRDPVPDDSAPDARRPVLLLPLPTGPCGSSCAARPSRS